MNQSLPLWCCLSTESQQALSQAMLNLGVKIINVPNPVWRDYTQAPKISPMSEEDRLARTNRFMSQKPHSPKRLA